MILIKKIGKYILDLPTEAKNKIYFQMRRVRIGRHSEIKGKILVSYNNIRIGRNCTIYAKNRYNPIGFGDGCSIVAEKTGSVVIGDYFGMSNSAIYSRIGIEIGNHVMLGGGVKIYDTDFHSLDPNYRGQLTDKQHTISKKVKIDDNVFIGAGSIILKGVHIGEKAIIGAGSVVACDIPAEEVWAGNPAKRIR